MCCAFQRRETTTITTGTTREPPAGTHTLQSAHAPVPASMPCGMPPAPGRRVALLCIHLFVMHAAARDERPADLHAPVAAPVPAATTHSCARLCSPPAGRSTGATLRASPPRWATTPLASPAWPGRPACWFAGCSTPARTAHTCLPSCAARSIASRRAKGRGAAAGLAPALRSVRWCSSPRGGHASRAPTGALGELAGPGERRNPFTGHSGGSHERGLARTAVCHFGSHKTCSSKPWALVPKQPRSTPDTLRLVQAGAAVVSMSLGSSGYDPAYSEVATLLRDAGILWVVPAGNGEANQDHGSCPVPSVGYLLRRLSGSCQAAPLTFTESLRWRVPARLPPQMASPLTRSTPPGGNTPRAWPTPSTASTTSWLVSLGL